LARRRKSPPRGKTGKPRAAEVEPKTPEAESKPATPSRTRQLLLIGLAVAAAVLVLAAGLIFTFTVCCTASGTADLAHADLAPEPVAFVGTETCISCHQKEGAAWHASQHAHAMAHATADTVLGDFDDASFDYYGVTSRFFKKDGKFFVETDGSDGKLATFEVKYTFGLDPLQQYLVEFPDGRIQALSIAWDTRPKSQGGQRWFHLYPDEDIIYDDPLHWTKLNQNWNFMCAECHSTGVAKNYDAAKDSFATTWKEISIGCEACHGQGSAHVAWAKNGASDGEKDKMTGLLARFDERSGVTWSRDPKTDQPQRSAPPALLRKEVEMCGRCHARRGEISEDWVPGRSLSDTHVVSLLAHGLYQADGQMLDEVYNYGSFKQSKMFAKGVTCSDCHDPHRAKLRASGNQVCLQCHASRYDTPAHTHHEGVTPALTCVSCHMPVRTYMRIDPRHDHSFRVPRPDLSAPLGVSNACNDCHKDKSPEWAAAAVTKWFGPERKGFQTYGPAFHAAWEGEPNAQELLSAVAADPGTPAFVRASALEELTAYPSPETAPLVKKGLADPDPLVRLAALDHLDAGAPAQLWPLVSPLLDDPVRGVRIKAASLLAGVQTQDLTARDVTRLASAEKEFLAAQQLNADRPEARSLLARYYMRKGDAAAAEREYRAALRLSPHFTPAAVNLADLYRQLGRDEDGVAVLREALQASPNDGGLHHALGLALVRLKQQDAAIKELRRAAELEPNRSRYAYVYAVGLESIGRRTEAVVVLKENLKHHPHDPETLLALINFARADGDAATALGYAEQLAEVEPDNQRLNELIQALKDQVSTQKSK
jgi:predicted CXXCH cytochrome family protein